MSINGKPEDYVHKRATRMSLTRPEDFALNEQFIKMVEASPMLWNIHTPLYRNRDAKDEKWSEIGQLFNLSGISAKNYKRGKKLNIFFIILGAEAYRKFVGLREKYKREQKLKDSPGSNGKSTWILYETMTFLDKVSFTRDRRW